jgi:hypothetical protein
MSCEIEMFTYAVSNNHSLLSATMSAPQCLQRQDYRYPLARCNYPLALPFPLPSGKDSDKVKDISMGSNGKSSTRSRTSAWAVTAKAVQGQGHLHAQQVLASFGEVAKRPSKFWQVLVR